MEMCTCSLKRIIAQQVQQTPFSVFVTSAVENYRIILMTAINEFGAIFGQSFNIGPKIYIIWKLCKGIGFMVMTQGNFNSFFRYCVCQVHTTVL